MDGLVALGPEKHMQTVEDDYLGDFVMEPRSRVKNSRARGNETDTPRFTNNAWSNCFVRSSRFVMEEGEVRATSYVTNVQTTSEFRTSSTSNITMYVHMYR
jgi:hypothetical protein